MFKRIFGTILAGGIAELFLLIAAGSKFGALPVIAEIIVSAIIGAAVIRHFGLRSLVRLQAEMQSVGQATEVVSHGVFGTIAGVLLISPGLLGDIAGALLLIPAVQKFLLLRFIHVRGNGAGFTHTAGHERIIVIEGEATEIAGDAVPPPSSERLK